MCNLSQGVFERGMEKGIQQGKAQGELSKAINTTMKMLKAHKPVKEIIEFTELPYAQIKELADSLNIPLVTEWP